MSQEQALKGVRILDFREVLAGPFETQQLGAKVIKIEQPVGVWHFTQTDKPPLPAQQHPPGPRFTGRAFC